jgi:hypothetical protein
MNGLSIYGYVRLINEDVALPAVSGLQAVSAGKNKVSLSWIGERYADGYLIYARKNGTYGFCGMTYGTTLDEDTGYYMGLYTDTHARTDTNDYYVFPFVTDYNGTIHPGSVSIKVTAAGICPAVENLTLTPSVGQIALTWDSSPDAEGYLIYARRAGGAYSYIGMTTTGTTYIDSLASSSQTNYYWVFPYFRDENNQIIPGHQSEAVSGIAQ